MIKPWIPGNKPSGSSTPGWLLNLNVMKRCVGFTDIGWLLNLNAMKRCVGFTDIELI